MNRPVQQGQMLMSVEDPSGDWELEVQMPEERMGFIVDAQKEFGANLPVKYRTKSNAGAGHEGTLREIHRTAEVRGEEGNTVLLRIAIDKHDLTDLRTGAEVTAKVYCGQASLGYVWLHDLISWFQLKILFRVF
jgi:HlyD family secretion protein